jgi:hypothetical protein
VSARPAISPRSGFVQPVVQAEVNGDGRCDAADWAVLRRYADGVTRTVAEP